MLTRRPFGPFLALLVSAGVWLFGAIEARRKTRPPGDA
jgi:hypothetical protein